MPRELTISIGQYSSAGRKDVNQDFHGALIPLQPVLSIKGIAIAIADGISSSNVSHIAAQTAIKSFLSDYYCTSDAWTAKTSAQRVISAANSWLHSETKRSQHAYDMDKGYVCTLSAIILKSRHGHIFHVGDTRIYRVVGQSLEQLTNDHRVILSSSQSYLGRALGANPNVEIDYRQIDLDAGDTFVLATDGVYEFVSEKSITQTIADQADDLDQAARIIADQAYEQGSHDNLTVQIVRVDTLPDSNATDVLAPTQDLIAPPLLEPGTEFDGYDILRELHANSRSHIYLAQDQQTQEKFALKIPSIDLRDDPEYLKRFMMEEWIARRLNNPHVLKSVPHERQSRYLYVISEYVEGKTLAQWMIDNPRPELEQVRDIIEQIAKGLRAFHRKEMLHQDLRPENVMMDQDGTIKIIDFGSTRVAGVVETTPVNDEEDILGTVQYTAPEYFIGEVGSRRSDFFSLGVIAYHMLTGRLPYGTKVSGVRTRAQMRKLRYRSALDDERHIPDWIDGALRKMVNPDPYKRYEALSEFTGDLRNPNKTFMVNAQTPLAERDPVLFWKTISAILLGIIVILVATLG